MIWGIWLKTVEEDWWAPALICQPSGHIRFHPLSGVIIQLVLKDTDLLVLFHPSLFKQNKLITITLSLQCHYPSFAGCLIGKAHLQLSTDMRKKQVVSFLICLFQNVINEDLKRKRKVLTSSRYSPMRYMIWWLLLFPVFPVNLWRRMWRTRKSWIELNLSPSKEKRINQLFSMS